MECRVTQEIWRKISRWQGCQALDPVVWSTAGPITDAWLAMIDATAPALRGGVQSLIILICHSIWSERNNRVFREQSRNTEVIVQFVRDEAREWAFVGAKKLRKLMWEPP